LLFARLGPGVALKAEAGGVLSARFDGRSRLLGAYGVNVLRRAEELATGLPLLDSNGEEELRVLIERLAFLGLVDYRLARAAEGPDIVAIEPQMRDYRPSVSRLDESRQIALSRFALLRRRGEDFVLESPLSGATFRLCDASAASTIMRMATPRRLAELRSCPNFPGDEFLGLLLDGKIAFMPDPDRGLRASEGDDDLALWEFHDLLFHVRSTKGRHANPVGGLYAHAHLAPQPPAVRPAWPGPAIELDKFSAAAASPLAGLLRRRRSARDFDSANPITLAEVARLLDGAARIVSRERFSDGPGQEEMEIAARPYPSGGASYELELYLAVDRCDGLSRGFYHYDADRHVLVAIEATDRQLEAILHDGQFAMGAPDRPQILIVMAARFGRVSWKYSGFAYSLVLKHVGTLMQTLYLMATEMGLGACAIGVGDIDLFERMTGLPFHVEGAVGQMAIGRGAKEPGDAPR
jgi:SagB-type dehydrogenase family enzyme